MLTLDWLLTLIVSWLVIGLAGLFVPRNLRVIANLLYPLGALVALAVAFNAFVALNASPQVAVLVLGLPDLPFHVRLDALSALFLFLLGCTAAGISIYTAGYLRPSPGHSGSAEPGLQCLEYHLFLASMAMLLIADDAYAFMVAWESMAMASFLLVTTNHRDESVRHAGYLYLLMAHVGAISILLCFGVLQSGGDPVTGSSASDVAHYTFAHMRAMHHDTLWASAAFGLALLGFGVKAGLLPLHVWLPEAHPAAPSPISALMSGVMLKTAIYGMLRVSFDLLHQQPLWTWGVVLLALGLLSALFGAIFSAVQSDMKRLLAYSSIENIGLLFVGIGLTLTFQGFGMTALAALSLTAVLYHCLNHAAFKSLLFLCTGSVLHATGERSLGKLGGLIHPMPWVAWLALIGVLSSAGLPPFNGFVSEWLLLQSFLFTPSLPHGYLNMLIPVAAAAVALTAALAGYVMVKFFGIVFLGRPREEETAAHSHDAGWYERIGLLWLAAQCVLLGLFPVFVIEHLDAVTRVLLGRGVYDASTSVSGRPQDWWLLAPINSDRASYAPLVFFLIIAAVTLMTALIVHRFRQGRVRRSAAWDCGFPLQTSRMQDTAEGFSQPLRQIFEPFYRMTRELPGPFDTKPHYRVIVKDHFWYILYLPIARIADYLSGIIMLIQQGRIAIYLLYSLVTLIVLLFLVRM